MKQSVYSIKENIIKEFKLNKLFFVYGGIDYEKEVMYIYFKRLGNERYINKMWNNDKKFIYLLNIMIINLYFIQTHNDYRIIQIRI